MLPSQQTINHLLLQEGLAWWHEKYAPDKSLNRLLEKQAQREGLGLWADFEPTAPWEWRKKGRKIEAPRKAEEADLLADLDVSERRFGPDDEV